MPSLPTPGSDLDTWGDELNEFLEVSHNADGTLATIADTLSIGTVSPFPTNDPSLFIRRDWDGTPDTSGNANVIQTYSQAKGTWTTSHFLYSFENRIVDHTSVNQKTVTGAANNGNGAIRLTVTGHGYSTGDRIVADSVGGTTEANASWIVTRVDANTLDLQGSTFTHAYTSGGITTNRAGYACFLGLVAPQVDRGQLAGVNAHADDVACFFGSNNGTAKATDFLYLGNNTGIVGAQWDTAMSTDGATYAGLLVNNVVGSSQQVFRGTAYGSGIIPEVQGRMARGTFNAPLRTKNGDLIGRFSAVPAVAASDVAAASFAGVTTRIDMVANEDQTVTGQGSRIVFYTTPISSTTIREAFRIPNTDGIDFNSGTFTNYQIRLKNNVVVQGMNNAGAASVDLFKINTSDQFEIAGSVKLTGSALGFFNTAPAAKPTVSGAKGSNAALASLMTALSGLGLITDSTSA